MLPRRPAVPSARSSARLALAALLAAFILAAGCGLGSVVTDFMDAKDTSLRKRVSLAPFDSGIASLKPRAQALGQAVAQALGKQGGVALVDFNELQAAIDRVDPAVRSIDERIAMAGRELGVNAVLAGVVTDLSVQYRLKGVYGFRDNTPFLTLEAQMRLSDLGMGTVSAQEAFKAEVVIDDVMAEGIRTGAQPDVKLVDKLAGDLTNQAEKWAVTQVNHLAWTGQVLEVQGNRLKVTVGADTGLSVGSTLAVYTIGEKIKAATGQEINLPGPLAGRIRLVELGPRASWGEAIEDKEQKHPFAPGQMVRTR